MQCKTKTGLYVTGGVLLSLMAAGICHADEIRDAYVQKLQEISQSYGEPYLNLHGDGDSYCSFYLTGLADASLIDFNQDGIDDLLVSYYCGGELQMDEFGDLVLPGAADYRVEIWTYSDGGLQQLYGDQQSGEYQAYVGNGEWSETNCLYHVWEKDGRPYLQIFEHAPGLESGISFQNISFGDDGVSTDEYRWVDGAFTRNGAEADPKEWMEGVIGDTLLHEAALSEYDIRFADEVTNETLPEDADQISAVVNTYHSTTNTVEQLENGSYEKTGKDALPLWARLYADKIVEAMLLNHTYSYDSSTQEDDLVEALSVLSGGDPYGVTDEDFQNEAGLFMDTAHRITYSILDIDHNGIPELILNDRPIEAGAFLEIYTVSDDQLVLCDRVGFAHAGLVLNENGDLASDYGHMGANSITKIDLEGTSITSTLLASSSPSTGLLINEIPVLDETALAEAREEYSKPLPSFNPASFFPISLI